MLPADFVRYTEELFGIERWQRYLEAFNTPAPVSIRVNPFKRCELSHLPIGAPVPWCRDAFYLTERPDFTLDPLLHAGAYYVQEAASMFLDKVIAQHCPDSFFANGSAALDLCAAPGGKTFTCAEIMADRGKIYSYDLYDGKVSVISNTAKRLGLSIITAEENDATKPNPNIPKADKVICDVPCSGLGVIRRKPEIKYKLMKQLETLPDTQRKIINNAAEYVKPGGTLIYSTCTVSKAENDDIVEEFLSEHTDFVPVVVPLNIKGLEDGYKRTMLPCDINGDGFFTATLRKVK